jgi:hypothetical protein
MSAGRVSSGEGEMAGLRRRRGFVRLGVDTLLGMLDRIVMNVYRARRKSAGPGGERWRLAQPEAGVNVKDHR